MSQPANRSPWMVKLRDKEAQKFRLKSQALAYLSTAGHTDPTKLPKGALKQLETAFEAQVKRKDKDGNVIYRHETFDTMAQASKWTTQQNADIDKILRLQGGFEVGFETITLEAALNKFHKEHYEGMPSFNEIAHRIPALVQWLGGPTKLLRELKKPDFTKLRDHLKAEKYSASSIRNFFTVLTSLYKHAANEWNYPVDNPASGINLPKPSNAVQRSWVGNERERLLKSLQLHSPWLIPIVEFALEMAFRRGELVQGPKNKKTKEQSGGLMWKHVDWENNILSLPKEKNDKKKKRTESLGRQVPLTAEMQAILQPLYDNSPTKSGLVFKGTINSVTGGFSMACKNAEPPITGLTFHSLRKISTKNLSRRVNNAMELSRLSGHKNIEVLNSRYYDVKVEDLQALLAQSSGTLRHRGVTALTKALGLPDARKFVEEILSLKSVRAVFK